MEEREQKERQRKKRAATPAAAETSVSLSGALSRLVHPLTWNVPMRQSGAADAWRLAREWRIRGEGRGEGVREWITRPQSLRGDRLSRASADAPLRASMPANTAGGGTILLERTRRNRPSPDC